MNPATPQQNFFQLIKAKLPANISLVDEIADCLNISIDSAYRRIRGEKPLIFDELQILSAKYKVSLDAVMKVDARSTVFYGTWLGPGNFDFEQYLRNLLMLAMDVARGTDKIVFYEAKDFPPFHYFYFPELSAFKYFFWMRTILNYPECSRMSFEDNDLGGILNQIGKQIVTAYNQFPSVEIWSPETINSTIRQIEYYREAGVFKKTESIEQLYDQLSALLRHVEEQAEVGKKFPLSEAPGNGSEFKLYFNDAYLGHNTIMTVSDGREAVFINHGVLNLMMTQDLDFCANSRRYFENTMHKSALISSTNDRERNRFFNGMQQKITLIRSNPYKGMHEMAL